MGEKRKVALTVNGKRYEFCCTPCLDKFVKWAKEKPDKIKDIDQVARGRIFLANEARDLGMVDELGGCDAAIAYAAKKAGLEEGAYDVRTLPAPKTLADLISKAGHTHPVAMTVS